MRGLPGPEKRRGRRDERALGNRVPRTGNLNEMTGETKEERKGKGQPVEPWELNRSEVEADENDPSTLLGEGSFGQVRAGRWQGHSVAIKRLLPKHHGKEMIDAFVNEIRVWHPLRHPNVLLLYGACVYNTKDPIMVMELMDTNLLTRLQKGPALPCKDVLRTIHEIALGMNFLHTRWKPVLHGDLKTANILLNSKGTVKISDFGFARLRAASSALSSGIGLSSSSAPLARASSRDPNAITTSGDPSQNPSPTTRPVPTPQNAQANKGGGTYFWMSPERLKGGLLKPEVDIYAFAMTCYEIISGGRIPFADSVFDLAQLVDYVVYQSRRPARPPPREGDDTPPHIARLLWTMVERCWDQTPANRPPFVDIIWLPKHRNNRQRSHLGNPSPWHGRRARSWTR
ncbi:kinase-like domain-containing protein [Cladochytrium replicatum]|nr:kinase-like domain-containing protein [Cladochytrium replicatum]